MSIQENVKEQSGRYITLDFLRGFSIFGMLIIHLMINIWDISWTDDMGSVPVFAILFLLINIYVGGWRGLFLMISGIGHMISMLKAKKKGIPVINIVKKQLTMGIILLIFAMLSETYIGYWGWIGQGILQDNWSLTHYLYRTLTQHTIHAVAWCLIINSLLFGLIGGQLSPKKVHLHAIIFAILAILAVVFTDIVWTWRETLVDQLDLSMGEWYQHGLVYAIICILTNPLVGSPEPLFPYLAVLFIGNIIGIYLFEDRPPKYLPQIGTYIGIGLFIIGIIGGIILGAQFEDWLPLRNPERINAIDVWLPWFMFCTGGQVLVVMLFLRLVEYRGSSNAFAKYTTFFRRFGIVPFTVYNFQWFELLPRWIIGFIFSINLMQGAQVNLGIYAIVLVVYLLFWWGILYIWEKIGYIGSFEWLMGWMTYWLNRLFTFGKKNRLTIMKSSKLDMKALSISPKWIDLSFLLDDDKKDQRETACILGNSIGGIFFFLFIPITFCLLARKTQYPKDSIYYKRILAAKIILGYATLQFIVLSIVLWSIKGLSL